MTEQFKKQFDTFSNIERAEDLAYTLGYDEAYLDGATITSPTYVDEMKNKITHLCGGNWTDKVAAAYVMGNHDGYMES